MVDRVLGPGAKGPIQAPDDEQIVVVVEDEIDEADEAGEEDE